MKIAVPKEIKAQEYRVGLSPTSVRELSKHGHSITVETGAGAAIGFADKAYIDAGATIIDNTETLYRNAELIVKVKEPQPEECKLLQKGQIVFAYLHLAPDLQQTELLLQSGAIAIAYETVTAPNGSLPLLAPMSEVAGRLAVQAGATSLEMINGGRGQLLGGVPGVLPAKVCIIGGGVVGINAAAMALGLGADVTVIDRSVSRLKILDEQFQGRLKTLYSTTDAIEQQVTHADLVIGAVLIPGAAAPKLVSADLVKKMQRGAVLVDVAIDQGGCFETSRPTSHDAPRYIVDGIVHYCVANIPGAVARTATLALNNATLPYVLTLADKGWQQALQNDKYFRDGLNIAQGKVYCQAVADAHGLPYETTKPGS